MSIQPDAVVKERPGGYRLTRYSVVWIVAALTLIPYEVWMVMSGRHGGPLSHVVWWAYGERYGARWWLIGMPSTALLLWAAWHFLLEWPNAAHLAWCVGAGLVVGAIGLAVTHA